MDARQQLSSPAVAAAAVSLLLLFSTFLGTQASGAGGMTALQKHAAFFDANNDGVVTFAETYQAFRDFGFGFAASTASATFINGALCPKTRPPKLAFLRRQHKITLFCYLNHKIARTNNSISDKRCGSSQEMYSQENDTSRLSVYIANIHRGIHGSDTGAYDSQGRFVPEKFEEIFAKHAKTVPDALTSTEVDELISANRQPSDYAGWAGAEGEWKILYSIGKDKDGLLRKDAARDVYDGSLFARVVQERRKSAQENLA